MLPDLNARVPIFASDSSQYGETAFPMFLAKTTQKRRAALMFDSILPPEVSDAADRLEHAIDGGAGDGVMIPTLKRRYRRVTAIEPSPSLADKLELAHPDVTPIRKNLMDVELAEGCAQGFILGHIFYYIPRALWMANLKHALRWLAPGGRGVVIGQNKNSSFQQMIGELVGKEHIFDFQPTAWELADSSGPAYGVKVITDDAHVHCDDLMDLALISVFMLNLVPAEVLQDTKLPTWGELGDWLKAKHPKNGTGVHSMSCRQDFVLFDAALTI